MGRSLIDCMDEAFEIKFNGNVPDEITPREVKDLRTVLNFVAQRMIGREFPKKALGEVIEEHFNNRGYEREFVKNYQALNRPQWVYRLPK